MCRNRCPKFRPAEGTVRIVDISGNDFIIIMEVTA